MFTFTFMFTFMFKRRWGRLFLICSGLTWAGVF